MQGYGSVCFNAELHISWWGDQCMALDELHKQNSSPCVCLESGHQVARRAVHFRKNRFSYACNLQQCGGISYLQKCLECQMYFEITWSVNFAWWWMLKLLRQTPILRSYFSLLFTEYTVGFTPINIFLESMISSTTHRGRVRLIGKRRSILATLTDSEGKC